VLRGGPLRGDLDRLTERHVVARVSDSCPKKPRGQQSLAGRQRNLRNAPAAVGRVDRSLDLLPFIGRAYPGLDRRCAVEPTGLRVPRGGASRPRADSQVREKGVGAQPLTGREELCAAPPSGSGAWLRDRPQHGRPAPGTRHRTRRRGVLRSSGGRGTAALERTRVVHSTCRGRHLLSALDVVVVVENHSRTSATLPASPTDAPAHSTSSDIWLD
jgi:hypothetical protein